MGGKRRNKPFSCGRTSPPHCPGWGRGQYPPLQPPPSPISEGGDFGGGWGWMQHLYKQRGGKVLPPPKLPREGGEAPPPSFATPPDPKLEGNDPNFPLHHHQLLWGGVHTPQIWGPGLGPPPAPPTALTLGRGGGGFFLFCTKNLNFTFFFLTSSFFTPPPPSPFVRLLLLLLTIFFFNLFFLSLPAPGGTQQHLWQHFIPT